MARRWTEEQRREQSERAKRQHAEGKLSGGVKVPRKLQGDKLLDASERLLLQRLKEGTANAKEIDAALRIAGVRGDRASPIRARLRWVIHCLPSEEQFQAAWAALDDEEQVDYLLALMGAALAVDAEKWEPLLAGILTLTEEDADELHERALARAYFAGNVVEADSEAEALALVEERDDIEERAWKPRPSFPLEPMLFRLLAAG